jgi:hypothetical protein
MACAVTISGVSYACTDIPTGGLTKVLIADWDNITTNGLVTANKTTGAVTMNPATTGLVTDDDAFYLEFNNKDGFSVFTDVKTVNPDGSFSVVPTVSVEFPVMTEDKRNELQKISAPLGRVVAFIETAAGTHHVVGLDYGLYFATVDGSSGTGRAEKNRFQITMTGEEDSLAYFLTSANWAEVIG